MKIHFKDAFNTLVGKKSYTTNDLRILGYGGDNKYDSDIADREALRFYARVFPVNKSINLISDKFKSLTPVLWDNTKNEFIKPGGEGNTAEQEELFALLFNPSTDFTQTEFFKQIAAFYMTTGNAYILAIGKTETKPLELKVIPSQYVDVQGDRTDGLVDFYRINSFGNNHIFKKFKKDGKVRYISGDGQELWHMRTFNPYMDSDTLKGLSLLNPVKKEIMQYDKSGNHNLAMLENGAFLGGILGVDNITQSQEQAIANQFNQKHTGSKNAHRVAVMNTKDISFTELGKTMRDMDFRNLRKDNEKSIYGNFNIPLPLVSEDASTFNNFDAATLKLYDNAIFPLANTIYQELTNFLLPRFGIEDMDITYDDNDIQDLTLRRTREFERLAKANTMTRDELRAKQGLPEFDFGGNVIREPLSLVPVAGFGKEEPKPEPEKEKTTRAKFIEIMSKQVDIKGVRKFTDTEITDIADRQGLK